MGGETVGGESSHGTEVRENGIGDGDDGSETVESDDETQTCVESGDETWTELKNDGGTGISAETQRDEETGNDDAARNDYANENGSENGALAGDCQESGLCCCPLSHSFSDCSGCELQKDGAPF